MAISQNTFSPAETYALKAQGYSDMGDAPMATVYWDLANQLWQYSGYANSTVSAYDNLLNYMAWNEGKLQSAAWGLYNELVSDINSQRTYVNDMFWPEWKLTKEVDKYYDDLWNYLATDAWRQAAVIAAQWLHSWASLWAIRAQQNEAYNQSFQRYVQAKEQQINAKQQIASNLINFMSTLRKEYWDSTNQYVIELYKRANDLYNNVALSLGSDLSNLNQLRLSSKWSWGSSSSSDVINDLLKLWWLGDSATSTEEEKKDNWVITSEEESKTEKDKKVEQAKEKLAQSVTKNSSSTKTSTKTTDYKLPLREWVLLWWWPKQPIDQELADELNKKDPLLYI